ncbi:DNA polymerase delta, subunit 4-domain-containing protein [Collybia nuda]|uniref:DNA polymerase delta, subunit 4-domain-containing protein n=1 Tax=Collybia nuda TaxID=64659 RepID=A0A9P6CH83_9AGAR|nr:DNA polymerase delta, subunit 4-domain-containing protein [Collybia nuda]
MSTKSLKQGTLSFVSSKRTTSSTPTNVKAKTSKSTKVPKLRSVSSSSSSVNEVDVDDVHLTSDEETPPEEEKKPERPSISSQVSSNTKNSVKKVKTKPETVLKLKEKQEKTLLPTPQERLELNEKNPRWMDHYAVIREKMNYKQPIHGESQNKIHEILRVFDLTYEYGPCVGVSRLERWERAQALGLNPPAAVHEILSTRQGTEQVTYSQSVFNTEV